MARRRTQDEAEAFIKVWQDSESLAEVSSETGMSPKQASGYASSLRRRGLRLKTFSAGLDLDSLASIIEEN